MQFRFPFITIGLLLIFCISGLAQQPTALKHGGSIQSIEFSPVDTSLVTSASDSQTIKLWNLQDNTSTTLTGHTDKVNSVTFSPDGKLLASGGNDRAIKIWDVQRKQNITTLKHTPSRSWTITSQFCRFFTKWRDACKFRVPKCYIMGC